MEPIGFSQSAKIKIPVIELGFGGPVISIIAGIHGDETTGLFVIQKLIKKLESEKLNCLVRIIPSANPIAQSTKTRRALKDPVDMNRVFSGKTKKGITSKIASKLVDLLKDSELVIDLHTFEMKTPLMGIFLKSKTEISDKNLRILQIFKPRQIWLLDAKSDKGEFKGTLGLKLNKMGIINFAVELSGMEFVKPNELEHCVQGILRTIRFVESKNSRASVKTVPVFKRKVIESKQKALFIPTKKPFEQVNKGEKIGELVSMQNFKTKQVSAKFSGVIMQISQKDLVLPGDELSAIGVEVM